MACQCQSCRTVLSAFLGRGFCPSGRAARVGELGERPRFLQEHGVRFDGAPQLGNYFLALRSSRRGAVLTDVSQSLIAAANAKLRDRLADIPELANYECFASDGHWHKAAAHDQRHKGAQNARGALL